MQAYARQPEPLDQQSRYALLRLGLVFAFPPAISNTLHPIQGSEEEDGSSDRMPPTSSPNVLSTFSVDRSNRNLQRRAALFSRVDCTHTSSLSNTPKLPSCLRLRRTWQGPIYVSFRHKKL